MADSKGGGYPLMGIVNWINSKTHDQGVHIPEKNLMIAFGVLNLIFLVLDYQQTLRNWLLVGFFAPLWAPYFFYKAAFHRYVEANKAQALAKANTVLLELRMPRDTQKTPLAMEAVLSSLHMGSGEGTWYKRLVQGGTRPIFSLEIASIGGRLRFFIWTREQFRRGIESILYAQYPSMEIIEAEDYSRLIDPSSHDYEMWGDEFIHTQKDPVPIKTYVDYQLDKPGAKPEEQIDPMTQMLEIMGGIGPEEQLWVQMIIRMSKSEKYGDKLNAEGKPWTWKDEAKEMVEKIRKETTRPSKFTDPATGRVTESEGFPNPTKGQLDAIASIERNTGKQGFDVGLRVIYSAPKTAYQGGKTIGFIISGIFKPFSSEGGNGFKPAANFDASFNDYPWEDPHGHHKQEAHEDIVKWYRRRSFFHEPYIGNWMIMSTEEIATMFHVPSATVATPGLARIQSTTAGAPANLPT